MVSANNVTGILRSLKCILTHKNAPNIIHQRNVTRMTGLYKKPQQNKTKLEIRNSKKTFCLCAYTNVKKNSEPHAV